MSLYVNDYCFLSNRNRKEYYAIQGSIRNANVVSYLKSASVWFQCRAVHVCFCVWLLGGHCCKRVVMMSMALDHGGRMIGFEGRGMEKWDGRGWGVEWAVIFRPTFLPPFFRWKGPKQARGTPALDVMMTQAHSCLFASWTCCISLLFTFACLTQSCAYQPRVERLI